MKKDITELYSFIDDFYKFTQNTKKDDYYPQIKRGIAYVV